MRKPFANNEFCKGLYYFSLPPGSFIFSCRNPKSQNLLPLFKNHPAFNPDIVQQLFDGAVQDFKLVSLE